MTDIKLLPPPKWLSEGFTDQTIRMLAVYTQANMAPLIAEIDRLRAELEIKKDQAEFYRITRNWNQQKARRMEEAEAEVSLLREEREIIAAEAIKYAEKSGHLDVKVRLLTEALRDVVADMREWGEPAKGAHVERIQRRLDDALRDHDQEENSDDR